MLFDAQTLAQLQRTQESTMMHTCVISPYIVGGDGTISYGAQGETLPCGFKALNGASSSGTLYETVTADAELRLPLGTQVKTMDRVTILSSFGRPLDPAPTYEVFRVPDSFGPSGLVVQLREIYS